MSLNTANKPPKPMAPMPSVSHTCGRASAPSSRSGLAPWGAGESGTPQRSSTQASAAMAPTNTNAARQPQCWPSQAAMGTPTKVALVRPSITRPAGGRHCQQWRADHHAQRVNADHMAGLRDADCQISRHLGQQAGRAAAAPGRHTTGCRAELFTPCAQKIAQRVSLGGWHGEAARSPGLRHPRMLAGLHRAEKAWEHGRSQPTRQTMKAAVLHAFGPPLVVQTWPDPVLGTGEVIADVVAAGVLPCVAEVFSGARGACWPCRRCPAPAPLAGCAPWGQTPPGWPWATG